MPTKALIVDDSPVTRSVISLILGFHKIKTTEAANGREALESLRRDPSIKLVMLDLGMPQMNGIEFLDEIRGKAEFKNLKVIVVTANDTLSAAKEAKRHGANDFITKPVSKVVVAEKLRRHGLN